MLIKQRRDLARVEELAERARKAEAAGFHLNSQPGTPGPGSARSARSDRSSERYNSRSQSRHASRLGPGARSPDPNSGGNGNRTDNRSPSYDPFSDRNDRDGIQSPIPIRLHSPDDEKNGNGNAGGAGGVGRSNSFAARALNEARNNLFKGNQAPARPARSPDLDLRLNPAQIQAQGQHGPPSSFQDLRSPTSSGNYRDSYLSGNSGAPSYLSGSTDLHMDAPKIVTSRQVQVGRLQQAEMVQFGQPRNVNMENLNLSGSGGGNVHAGGYVDSPAEMNPFHGSQESHDDPRDRDHLQPPMPMSPATFGSRTLGSEVSGVAAGNSSYRTLTPASNRVRDHNDDNSTDMDSEDEEGLYNEPISADLRFSMGSLAYNDNNRDSISTMGTGRYLAQHAPPPLPNANARGGRESMASGRSAADSVLHGFPMIPPGQSRSRSNSNPNNPLGHSPIPQSTSVSTLEHIAMPPRPPTSYRPSGPGSVPAPNPATPAQGANRATQGSIGLGGFTFVPPSEEGLPSAALPTGTSDGLPTLPIPRGRNTMGMSTTSEGLGEFDFSFDRDPVHGEQQRK
jgi:hypothetical protein